MTFFSGRFAFCCALALALLAGTGVVRGGEGEQSEAKALDQMTVDELREYQAYFYAIGERDPMTMRRPTDSELGLETQKGGFDTMITFEQMEKELTEALEQITAAIKRSDYQQATTVSDNILYVIDNEWPDLPDEHEELRRMADEIRSLNRLAVSMKNREEITKEFQSLNLKVDGVVWSPSDAKAVINGRTLSAGELMLGERRQGDLRIEMIEEHGVVFQFRGLRFRIPVEVHSSWR